MEIQSAFNSGIQGFQQAKDDVSEAAANIAVETIDNSDEISINQTTTNQLPVASEQKLPDLNQSIVDLKVAEFQAKSSAQVIITADEMLGTLFDVTA